MPLKWFSKGGNQRQELVSNNDSKGSNQNHELVPIDDYQTTQQIHQEDSDKISDKEINMPSNDNDISETTSDPQTAREQWSGQFDFLMSMIAYAVGLGNVWRFPYLCYKNGGGSFLVVYAICIAFAALPISIMEVIVVQYLQRGAMEVWKMCPIFKGVGIGNVVNEFIRIQYISVIVSWAVFYMIQSLGATFDETFPWETCGNQWNDNKCITGKETQEELKQIELNLTVNQKIESSVEQYWEHRVLHQTPTISDFGGIQWELLVIMFVSWVIVYFALWKGITKARKQFGHGQANPFQPDRMIEPQPRQPQPQVPPTQTQSRSGAPTRNRSRSCPSQQSRSPATTEGGGGQLNQHNQQRAPQPQDPRLNGDNNETPAVPHRPTSRWAPQDPRLQNDGGNNDRQPIRTTSRWAPQDPHLGCTTSNANRNVPPNSANIRPPPRPADPRLNHNTPANRPNNVPSNTARTSGQIDSSDEDSDEEMADESNKKEEEDEEEREDLIASPEPAPFFEFITSSTDSTH